MDENEYSVIYVLYDRDLDDPTPYRSEIMTFHKTLLGAFAAALESVTDGRTLDWIQPPGKFYWTAGEQFRVETYQLED